MMAIESAIYLRRLAQIATLVLAVVFLGCVSAEAQTPVMAGSVVGNSIVASQGIGQIYKIVVAGNGDVLFLDTQNGALYEMQAGSTSLITLSGPGQVLRGNQAFWNSDMALDQWNNLYIGGIYSPQPDFYRVPFDPKTNTWPLTGSSSWTNGNTLMGGLGVNQMAFFDSTGGSTQTMVISTETSPSVMEFTVDANGNVGTATTLVKSLTAEVAKLAVDHAGNVYFIEDPWEARTSVAVGLWMIPAGAASGTVGEVAPVVRIDPPADQYEFKGVNVDAAGDLYLSSEIDTGGTSGGDGNFAGVLMVPNESGSPTKATQSTLNWNHSVMVAPVTATAQTAIDSRGFLWIPTPVSGWAPVNSSEGTPPVYPGSMNYVVYSLGSVDLGTSPIATAGSTGSAYFTFNSTVTPAKIVFSQLGGGSDFTVVTTNPVMNPATASAPATVDTTVVPCTAGTTYTAGESCPYWIAVDPTVAGTVSGQLQMLDASGKVISNSAVYLHGVGQGAQVSILGSAAVSSIGSGFTTPEQVAVDASGATYVADSGKGKVLQYPAGSTTPVSIGTGLKSPTGVAVDGFGNVYIGDSGNVLEVPYQSGALNSADQTVLQTGLGNTLNLAVDGAGNVFVADQDKAQVVKIANASAQSTLFGASMNTVGTGFTAPSAVAVDGSGDLFVADGTNLDEVTQWSEQSTITTKLSGSVSGLAMDASGSVYVAESAGLLRIPMAAGALSFNDAITIGAGTVTTPTGVTIDRTGNVYVSYTANGTPGVAELSVNGSYDFGVVTPLILTPGDTQLFNIGNLPLTLSPFAGDTFTGTNGSDFSVQTAGDSPACDPSTPIATGVSCYFGFGVTPSVLSGTESGSLAILSNASNASSVNLAFSDSPAVDNRPSTVTTISPIAAVTYPGALTITVTVTSTAGTPQGTVELSLSNNIGSSSRQLDSNGVATFTFSNLNGGSYNVNATYKGYGTLGTAPDFAVSSATQVSFAVNPAAPTFTVSAPATYLLFGGANTISASVTSTFGVPTGTVTFMNGSALADPAQGAVTLTGLGQATFNTNNLALGTYNLTAVYSGDENYAASTVKIGTFQIINPSVLITASPATLTVTPGVAGTVALTLQGLVGYGGPQVSVTLACATTSLPQYAECSFDNPSVAITPAGGSATVNLTINTNVPVNSGSSASVETKAPGWALAGMFGFGLIGLAFRGKFRFDGRALMIVCLILLSLGGIFGVAACTNTGYTHTPPAPVVTTPAGSSSVVVTATDNTLGKVVSLPFTLPVTVN
jgi:sugar lactone lactonase YvrE